MATSRRGKKRTTRRRRIVSWAFLVVLIGLGILTAVRWRAWFGNTPESAYITPETIDRITLTPGEHFGSERTVSWRCGQELQDAWLEYHVEQRGRSQWTSLPADGKLVKTRAGQGCYYTARIVGLKAGERVRYMVRTGQAVSDTLQFVMPSGEETLTRFLYLGDVQDPEGTLSRQMMQTLRDSVIPQARPSFLAAAGDQIEGPTDAYWQIWYNALGAIPTSMPMILSTGNHEYLKRGLMRELDPRWCAQHHYPMNGPTGFEGRTYYIDFPLMRFIVLDTTDINDLMAVLRHRDWLASVLRSSAQPWQVVMYHHAVKCVRQGRSNVLMANFIKPILEEYGADLVLQGHDHAYSRIAARSESGSMQTPVYVISTSSPKVYRNEFDPIHDRLGSGLQLYQLIDVSPNQILYRSFLYGGELYDQVVIHYTETGPSPHVVEDRAQHIPELFLFNAFGSSAKGQEKAKRYREEAERRVHHRY